MVRTKAGKALLEAEETLGYDAYDAPHFMEGYDFTTWEEAIAAIEREAVAGLRPRLKCESEEGWDKHPAAYTAECDFCAGQVEAVLEAEPGAKAE